MEKANAIRQLCTLLIIIQVILIHAIGYPHGLSFDDNSSTGPSCEVVIPVSYLPAYERVILSNGREKTVALEGRAFLKMPATSVALILVDTWTSLDPKPGEEPSELLQRSRKLLQDCRRHGITVIHAPNHPIVDMYPQFHQIQKLVTHDSAKELVRKVPWGNKTYEMSKQLRYAGINSRRTGTTATEDALRINREVIETSQSICSIHTGRFRKHLLTSGTQSGRDISKFLLPTQDEFVVESHQELRYVLARNQITTLIYIGGSLNECMLQRPTGINALAGTDGSRLPFTLVVMEDCSAAMASPKIDAETMKEVMLEYYKFKIAFVANSSELMFLDSK